MEAMFNTKNKNRGQVLVLVALSLVVFIGFAALAIDVAYFYHTRHQLQGAADAGALAGASQLRGANTVSAFGNHSSARREAWKFACKNKAAGQDTYLVAAEADRAGCDNVPSDVYVGNTGDIVVGNWNGSFNPGGTPVNAIQVTDRRTDAFDGMPKVSTFFGRIFNVNAVNVSTTAIAARFEAPVLPIAVNEYWLQRDDSKRPYANCAHEYPRSFVRKTTVNSLDNVPPSPTDPTDCRSWGRTFAILGSDANDNIPSAGVPGSKNMNGYVNMDSRSHNHDGNGKSWGDLNTISPPAPSCTGGNCSSLLGTFPNYSTTKNTGSISPSKFDASLGYLHNGYPSNYILPTAVKEVYRSSYPDSNYLKPTSSCPFATLAYFPSSGNQPINKNGSDGKKFYEVFPQGKKAVALVYDGTFVPDTDPNMPNAVTVVGYVLLQIDGYASSNPKKLLNPGFLGDNGNTAYAHALSDIVEPTSPFGSCDSSFLDAVKNLQIQGGTFRLVQ